MRSRIWMRGLALLALLASCDAAGARPRRAPARKKAPAPVAARPPARKKAPPPAAAAPVVSAFAPQAPYRGAIAIEAATGRVLFSDRADNPGRPASVTKLMTLLLVLEDLQAGRYRLDSRAASSAYAATMEPSRVDIRPGQTMAIGDLLYALVLKSANDAAVVLAEHAAWQWGRRMETPPERAQDRSLLEAFVARMNRRAQELGMAHTRYASPNGLPPRRGEKRGWDVSTASDLARLARRLTQFPGVFAYTGAAYHKITDGAGKPLSLQNHNYFVRGNRDPKGLCTACDACDGFKTGFTAASGSSIVLTAAQGRRRVIVVVLSSAGRHNREAAAGNILRDALSAVSF